MVPGEIGDETAADDDVGPMLWSKPTGPSMSAGKGEGARKPPWSTQSTLGERRFDLWRENSEAGEYEVEDADEGIPAGSCAGRRSGGLSAAGGRNWMWRLGRR